MMPYPSVLALLLDNGVDRRTANRLVAPIITWFDQISPDLAEAIMPTLHDEIFARGREWEAS